MANDLDRRAHELSAVWDRLLAGEPVNGADLDPGMIETIDQLLALQSEESISDEIEGLIWAKVIGGTSEQWRPDEQVVADAQVSSAAASTGIGEKPQVVRPAELVVRFGWVIAAGFAGGFLAGISSRLAMRVAGMLTIDANRFRMTENGNRVGEFTLDGTMFLGLLAGSAGVVTLLLYLLLRNRLPFGGWQRSGVFAVLLLAVFGFVLMDPSNGDYQTFGPAWLNVSMFSSLYLIMGFLTSQIYEAGIRRDVTARILAARAPVRIPVVAASTALAGFGLLIMSGIAFLGAAALFLLVLVGLVAWFANRLIFASGREWNLYLPRVVQPLGLLVVPGILGFILTARGITEILMNR